VDILCFGTVSGVRQRRQQAQWCNFQRSMNGKKLGIVIENSNKTRHLFHHVEGGVGEEKSLPR
jgi:hypothetical protein